MLTVKWASFAKLVQLCGWLTALRVGAQITWDSARGQPFRGMPPARERSERESRAQLGPAVLTFKRLEKRFGADRAFEITAAVVEAGAHAFLRVSVGLLEREELAQLGDKQRRRYPNADFRVDDVSAEGVRFTVTRCRFVELCTQLGVSHLAPIFCAGDASYFGQIQEGVRLTRPKTIADGHESCPFKLVWIDEPNYQADSPSSAKQESSID